MTAETEEIAGRINDALRIVIDPELGYNIVDLGLIYSIDVEEGGLVEIVMTTTTRGCPATAYLKEGTHDGAWSVPGVEFVNVMLTYDPPWSPDMMTDAAKQHLGFA